METYRENSVGSISIKRGLIALFSARKDKNIEKKIKQRAAASLEDQQPPLSTINDIKIDRRMEQGAAIIRGPLLEIRAVEPKEKQ